MKNNMKEKKYLQCWKCGNKVSTDSDILLPCIEPAWYRTSGICGGSYDIVITEEEFLNQE